MQDTVAASRYAQALFEIARQMEQDQAVEDELQALSEALKNSPVLEKMMLNPSLTLDHKKKVVERLYARQSSKDVAKLMTGFLAVLMEKSRFPLIHAVGRAAAQDAQGSTRPVPSR